MNSTACAQCGEKILPHWTLCPVCATPFADAIAIDPAKVLTEEDVGLPEICCVQCKGIITPEAQICPHCHVLIIRRYCSGCSRLIPEQAGWCPYCGTSAMAKRKRFKFYLQSAVILLVAGSIFAGIFFLVKKLTGKPVEVAREVQKNSLPEQPPPAVEEKAEAQKPKIEKAEPEPLAFTAPDDFPEADPIPEQPIEEEASPVPIARQAPARVASSPEVPEEDWEKRGAKLLQGRKLTQNASRLMQKGKYTDASILLMEALRIFPKKTDDLSYGEALYKLGICLRKKGQPEEAIPVFKEAMRFAVYRSKIVREVEAATSELKRARMTNSTKTGTRR